MGRRVIARGATAAAALIVTAMAACSGAEKSGDDDAGSAQSSASGSGGTIAGAANGEGSGGRGGSSSAGGTGGRSSFDAGASPNGTGGSTHAAIDGGVAPAIDGGAAPAHDGGMPMTKPFKGVANSPCNVRSALGVSWYYNWGQTETEPCNDGKGGEFVPMIWGHTGAEQTASSITSAVASFVGKGYAYVLGFNEPDNSTQSNIPVNTAIALWPAFDNPAIKIASPGTAANQNQGQAWFSDFMMQLNADADLRADVIAIHWYGWNAGSCDAKAAGLENYIKWAEGFPGNRPIWITEWGCLNQSAPDEATVLAFYQGALAVFAKHPRIERYAWYPWATNCHLAEDDGTLTALGKAYAAAPAYK